MFSGSSEYESEEEWRSEQHLHLVDPRSEAFGWKHGVPKFKWSVKAFARVSSEQPVAFENMDRHYRSIYRLKDPLTVKLHRNDYLTSKL